MPSAKKGINITSIVGIAEDTDGALMLSTSDPAGTRSAFEALKLDFEEHDPEAELLAGGDVPGDRPAIAA